MSVIRLQADAARLPTIAVLTDTGLFTSWAKHRDEIAPCAGARAGGQPSVALAHLPARATVLGRNGRAHRVRRAARRLERDRAGPLPARRRAEHDGAARHRAID